MYVYQCSVGFDEVFKIRRNGLVISGDRIETVLDRWR